MATFTSVQDGNWQDGATWGNNSPGVKGTDFPGNNDTINIDHEVTYDAGENTVDWFEITDIRDGGVLIFPTDSSSIYQIKHATTTRFFVRAGGELRAGTPENPVISPNKVTLLFQFVASTRTILETFDGAKINMYGDSDFYGGQFAAFLKQNWTTGTTFYVEGDLSGKWKAGQLLWLGRMSAYAAISAATVVREISSVGSYDEENDRTPITIAGSFPAGPWLAEDGYTGFRSVVLNFSRNIEWRVDGAPVTAYGHNTYAQRIQFFCRQSVNNDRLGFNNVYFHGLIAFNQSLAAVAERYNLRVDQCVFLNCRESIYGQRDIDVKDTIFSSNSGLYDVTIKDTNELDSSNYFVSCFYGLRSVKFNMDRYNSIHNYHGINTIDPPEKITIKHWYSCGNLYDSTGITANTEVLKYVSVGNGSVCLNGTLASGTGRFSIEILDGEIFYPVGASVLSQNGLYFRGSIKLSSNANIFISMSNFVVEDTLVEHDNPNNTSRFVNACTNFVLRNVEMNFCDYAFFGTSYSFLALITIGIVRTAFFRADVYDGRISGHIGTTGINFFYDTVRNVFFLNTKIDSINNWFRTTTSFISEIIYSLCGFENCELEGVQRPLRLYTNSGNILPLVSTDAGWQNPPSANSWVFKMIPNLYCGRTPLQRLKISEEGRKTSFVYVFAGERKITFKVYPVGWTNNLSGKDLRVHLFWNNLDNTGENTINDWEDMYENNGWCEISFQYIFPIDTVVHYNLELTVFEEGSYVLFDPVVKVEAVV